jgi:hypothetical protein
MSKVSKATHMRATFCSCPRVRRFAMTLGYGLKPLCGFGMLTVAAWCEAGGVAGGFSFRPLPLKLLGTLDPGEAGTVCTAEASDARPEAT